MVEMTTQLPTARHQSASRRTGSNLHQVNRDTAPQRHPDHSASQVSRTDAYQVNPSLLAGILLISPLRKLRNSTRNEKQLRGRQAKSGQGANTNGRDIGRRFTDGDPMRALTSAKVWAEVWASTCQERQARDWRGLEGYIWRRDSPPQSVLSHSAWCRENLIYCG